MAALRAQCADPLPADSSLLRNWKRWEAGDSEPDAFYKRLIAKTFGTVTAAVFPISVHRGDDAELLHATGMDTVELLARMRACDVSPATLDAVRIAADRLCCEYPYAPPQQLRRDGLGWLRRILALLDRRLTLAQHHEVLRLAGLFALLVGCVEYDLGWTRQAEATRQAALSLGQESADPDIQGWAHEMRAWFALTTGDYRGVIASSEVGETIATGRGVAVQLAAQRAKAWARLGDRRQVAVALDQGRSLLDSLEHPSNLDHHFVVDPSKFDFYAMDCYRLLGDDNLARMYADEVIRSSTGLGGVERKPMRVAEARVTLGVVACREGDLGRAVAMGELALVGERRSVPSLVMCSRELSSTLRRHYPQEAPTMAYLERLHALATASVA